MASPADPAGEDLPPHAIKKPQGSVRRFMRIAGGYWKSDQKWSAWGLTSGLIVLGIAQILLQIWINLWNKDFFDAVEHKNWSAFFHQMTIFAAIVVISMAAMASHLTVKRRLQYSWRRWLSARTVDRWLESGRHYQLGFVPGDHDNPDARIGEDVRISTEFAVEFAQSIFYCVLLLCSFMSILWELSGSMTISLFGSVIEVRGYMVWVAIAYAFVGSALTFFMGRSLVAATDLRQSREADYRFGLVRVREHAEGIALMRGEAGERDRLRAAFLGIRGAWFQQTQGQRRLISLTTAYGTLATVFPIIVAAPRYFSGAITLGGLMQTAQAFMQVQSALSWFVDNFPRFAEWNASAERVLALHQAIDDLQEEIDDISEASIIVQKGKGATLIIQGLDIAQPDGTVLVNQATAEIHPGDRVLIKGESGSGKSTLFRAIAGLWPWGQGTILLPADSRLMFMPQRPYLPVGTLRTALAFPAATDEFDKDAYAKALERVNLGQLVDRLDEEEEQWDRVLSGGEQQRVGFARMILHKPDWVFLDEATAALDDESQDSMMRIFTEDMPTVTVLSVAHRPGLEGFHGRELELIRHENGATLTKAARQRREQLRALQRKLWGNSGALWRRLSEGLDHRRYGASPDTPQPPRVGPGITDPRVRHLSSK
jgi:putative ATP-binding cassette transporter